MLTNDTAYLAMLENIKREIATTRYQAAAGANRELICMYWRIGKAIDEEAEWGSSFIDTLSHDIRNAFPGIKGFSSRNLKYMLKFYREHDKEFVQTVSAQMSWSHNVALMDKVKDGAERAWYAHAVIENGWSHSVLVHHIELKLYERQALAGKVTNFERTLPDPASELAQQALKDPYIFDFITARQSKEEHDIEEAMVSNVTKLLLELGTGFAFMGRQYHFVVGEEDFYIDLLFYNTKLHCYVVIELKNDKFKPEYAGKLSFYISAVDGELRDGMDNPTIGLLLCKSKDDVVAKYSLQDINQPIGVSEYKLDDFLPEGFAEALPSPEDLEARL